MPRFNYIHLSDTHLCVQPNRRSAQQLIRRNVRYALDTAWQQSHTLGFLSVIRPASYLPEIAAGAAQFCFERFQILDGIILTGDLATTGIITDINAAHSFVTAPATAGFYAGLRTPTLGFMGADIYVVPGNHDKFSDSKGTPNCKNFELTFEANMPNLNSGVGHWVVQKQSKHLGFVYADFCLQSRLDAEDKVVGAFGQGRVYEDVYSELTKRTLQLRGSFRNIPIVWIIHFAPFDCGYGLKLNEFDKLVQGALRLKVAATLCGHTHKASKTTYDDHVIYCGGSAGCVDSENDSRIHVIQFDVDEQCRISRDNYIWDRGLHEFIHHSAD